MVNKDNVLKLVEGAWTGMTVVMDVESDKMSAEDVISAAVTLADKAIAYACSAGKTPEENSANKLACRNALQQMLLKTSDNLKVF